MSADLAIYDTIVETPLTSNEFATWRPFLGPLEADTFRDNLSNGPS